MEMMGVYIVTFAGDIEASANIKKHDVKL